MSKYAQVVIVGRTNVGKSTLFNRLSVSARSITFDQEGVTRDFIKDIVTWRDKTFELIDTGGISLRSTNDPILKAVRAQALELLKQASVLVFVVDNQVGITTEDQEISVLCHKLNKHVMVTVNKVDNPERDQEWHAFDSLGHEHVLPISSLHGTGIDDLLDTIISYVPSSPVIQEEDHGPRVVLLGKPNVGKSSLMNLLLEQERSIVSNIAGTTREPISERITFYRQDIQLTDTPGIRRKRAIDEPLEQMMVKTAFKAMEQSDIVLLLVDGSQEAISDQELKLAFYAFEHKKALIILLNKDDLAHEESKAQLSHHLELYKHFLTKIPQLAISCLTKKNIGKILPLVDKIWGRYTQQLDDDALNIFIRSELERRQLYHSGKLLTVYHTRQVRVKPPTFEMTVNEPKWFGESQLAFFENALRKEYDLLGVPLVFFLRARR